MKTDDVFDLISKKVKEEIKEFIRQYEKGKKAMEKRP